VADCGTSVSAAGVWYSFQGTGMWTSFSVCDDANYDTKINVYSGSIGNLNCAAGNDDGSACLSPTSKVSVQCNANLTYYILVQGYNGDTGDFSLTVTCEASSTAGQDCTGAQQICDDTTFGGNNEDFGAFQDLSYENSNCLTIEHQSSWFYFTPLSVGSIEFTITPSNGIDYDFAIWGPFDQYTCPPAESPIRCSYSDDYAPTGLVDGCGDNSEPYTGDAWVENLEITAAEVNKQYLLLIDTWTADNTSFAFEWNLDGVILDCPIMLPIELLYFKGKVLKERNELSWATASEHKNNYFEIQRSQDLTHWDLVKTIHGQGDSNDETKYLATDPGRPIGVSYYRLKQVDFDGQSSYSEVITLENNVSIDLMHLYPNPIQDHLNISINSLNDSQISLEIYDLSGRNVKQQKTSLQRGSNIFKMNLEELKKGIYALKIVDSNHHLLFSEKILKK